MGAEEKLIVVVGPTAVGKSAISVELADLLDGEIISADSMQVYREMNIGTAKIQAEEMVSTGGKRILHHLIDIRNPDENFTVADFQQLARNQIRDINTRGKIPILVGGTGLYVNAVIDPYNFIPEDYDPQLRNQLMQDAEKRGNQYLYNQLVQIDPETAEKFHPNDLRRIVRALETFYQTGRRISHVQQDRQQERPYDIEMIGLFCERGILYDRINQRVDQMIENGLIEEVTTLIKKGYSPRLKSMQGLGYRQIAAYLTGIVTKEEGIRLLKRDTRHFAKRQFTWFKRDPRIKWFDVMNFSTKTLCGEKIYEILGGTTGAPVE
ncbi:tRNA (adenosine(37)-N6)-dimethylallyltransferase MiaA [Dehalobacterium formicoaceticum]|uniref:tRNA (adenosine(37)-N6)-dimethylallyltransferase MiaA n=1 Tax=Dehalobacterium formicoaceticum TaxID=51515 RepID=UPI000B7E549F|nr:tRNA (adenosine(37)-N6)-dimethylallyltransferase MiaA [Dehalobacterium formicoaceticum]